MFLDVVQLNLKAGDGGNGVVSWRREKYEPSGGPYGGDGGKGGDIYLIADNNVHTLLDFKYKRHYKAEKGEDGRTKRQYGKKGEDLELKVPVGTMVREAKSKLLIADLREKGEKFLIAKGGRGGRGNAKFANSIHQSPRFAEPGDEGQEIDVILEVKLIADVGLVGMPNVGKSSILSIISDAKPKIDNYHFTTLSPNLGFVRLDYNNSFVIADIPGLIEGASQGVGLGHDFLRHIERTRVLVHVLDMSGLEGRDPLEDFETINKELEDYSEKLKDKLKIVVANKKDIDGYEENLKRFVEKYPQYKLIETSAATTEGIDKLKAALSDELNRIEKTDYALDTEEIVDLDQFFTKDETIDIYELEGAYYAEGDPIRNLLRRINFEEVESLQYLHERLEEMGIMDRVREMGIKDGDSLFINGIEMEYFEW